MEWTCFFSRQHSPSNVDLDKLQEPIQEETSSEMFLEVDFGVTMFYTACLKLSQYFGWWILLFSRPFVDLFGSALSVLVRYNLWWFFFYLSGNTARKYSSPVVLCLKNFQYVIEAYHAYSHHSVIFAVACRSDFKKSTGV